VNIINRSYQSKRSSSGTISKKVISRDLYHSQKWDVHFAIGLASQKKCKNFCPQSGGQKVKNEKNAKGEKWQKFT
jgi:hypothetical protein